MAVMINAEHSGMRAILAEVPPGCALLDAPMSAACGVLDVLGALSAAPCPMFHVGDRVLFLVRAELDFAVEWQVSVIGERSFTFWPSPQMAGAKWSDQLGEESTWIVPPQPTGAAPPDVATVLDAINQATIDAAQPAVDALTWSLACDQVRRHMADAGECSACAIGGRCAWWELAVEGLHTALSHPSAENDYWRGLTRIRRSQRKAALAAAAEVQ